MALDLCFQYLQQAEADMMTFSTTGPKPACATSATPADAASCPDPEALLSLCSGRELSPSSLPLLLHLVRCRACQAALAFTAASAMLPAVPQDPLNKGKNT